MGLTIAFGASAQLVPRPDLPAVVTKKPTRNNFGHYLKGNLKDPTGTLRNAPEDLIYEQPEGELKSYKRSGYGIDFWDQTTYELNGNLSIVYAPDGQTVYIQNPVSYFWPDVWITGTIQGNKITIPLGQYFCWEEEYDGSIFAAKLAWGSVIKDEEDKLEFVPDPTVTEVTFTIDGDVITLDNTVAPTEENPIATGWAAVNDDDEPFNMEFYTVFTLFTPPTLIYGMPAGELKTYKRSGYFQYYDESSYYDQGGFVNIVYAPDGETVYILNPVYSIREGIWVEGTIQGNTITVPMGQYIYWDDEGYGLTLEWVTKDPYQMDPDNSVTEATYTINNDVITLDNSYGDDNGACGLGAVWDDDHSVWCMEWSTVLNEMPTIITELPMGLDEEVYLKSCLTIVDQKGLDMTDEDATTVIAFDYDSRRVFIRDFSIKKDTYESWLCGTLNEDGTKIIVPVGQCYSYDDYDNTGCKLVWGSTTAVESDGYYLLQFTPDTTVEAFTFTIHDNGCISLDNSTTPDYIQFLRLRNQYWNDQIDWETFQELALPLWNQTGIGVVSFDGEYISMLNCNLKYSLLHPAVPADPVIIEWYDSQNENGDSYLYIEGWNKDVDGFRMEDECISYTIYTDNDQPFAFSNDDYSLYGEDIIEVTYNFWYNMWELYPSCIYFYHTNAEGFEPFFNQRIGIQFHYTVDGVTNSSNIVYLDVFEETGDDMPGDVDGSGNVDIDDVTKMISRVLGSSSEPGFIDANADLNGDHSIDIDDVTIAINKVLGNN